MEERREETEEEDGVRERRGEMTGSWGACGKNGGQVKTEGERERQGNEDGKS